MIVTKGKLEYLHPTLVTLKSTGLGNFHTIILEELPEEFWEPINQVHFYKPQGRWRWPGMLPQVRLIWNPSWEADSEKRLEMATCNYQNTATRLATTAKRVNVVFVCASWARAVRIFQAAICWDCGFHQNILPVWLQQLGNSFDKLEKSRSE